MKCASCLGMVSVSTPEIEDGYNFAHDDVLSMSAVGGIAIVGLPECNFVPCAFRFAGWTRE